MAAAATAQASKFIARRDNATTSQTGSRSAAAPKSSTRADDGQTRSGARAEVETGGSAAGDDVGSDMQSGWDKLRSRPFRRYIALNSFMAQAAWRVFRANRTNEDAVTEATAAWVKDGLLRLGPTMIKLGQV
jgi:hypothetical protein